MNHVVIGACLPYLFALILYARNRARMSLAGLAIFPALMAAGGIWAVIPDIPRVIGWSRKYQEMADDPGSDLFFWHYSLDATEGASPIWPLIYVTMLASILIAIWREIHIRERP